MGPLLGKQRVRTVVEKYPCFVMLMVRAGCPLCLLVHGQDEHTENVGDRLTK